MRSSFIRRYDVTATTTTMTTTTTTVPRHLVQARAYVNVPWRREKSSQPSYSYQTISNFNRKPRSHLSRRRPARWPRNSGSILEFAGDFARGGAREERIKRSSCERRDVNTLIRCPYEFSRRTGYDFPAARSSSRSRRGKSTISDVVRPAQDETTFRELGLRERHEKKRKKI